MSGKKETYVYGSLKERFALEWKIYALAFGFILIGIISARLRFRWGKECLSCSRFFMQLFWGY